MKQVYLREVKRTEASTPTYYTKDDQVKPGKLLIVRSLALTWSDIKTSETGQFYIQDGGQKIFIGEDVPDRQGGHAFWQGEALVGEGDLIGAYTPDSANGDVIYFDIVGELWDLKDWEKGME